MKLITPPKLMPPCHSAAAIGTLPIEHTKLMNAMNGPTMTFSRLVQKPWPSMNTSFQTSIGTSTVEEPGDDVADHELLPQHRDVGHRVARRRRTTPPSLVSFVATASARARLGARR